MGQKALQLTLTNCAATPCTRGTATSNGNTPSACGARHVALGYYFGFIATKASVTTPTVRSGFRRRSFVYSIRGSSATVVVERARPRVWPRLSILRKLRKSRSTLCLIVLQLRIQRCINHSVGRSLKALRYLSRGGFR